jgi:hypothetical protein
MKVAWVLYALVGHDGRQAALFPRKMTLAFGSVIVMGIHLRFQHVTRAIRSYNP